MHADFYISPNFHRYKLLLEELLNNMESPDEDYENIRCEYRVLIVLCGSFCDNHRINRYSTISQLNLNSLFP